VAADDDAGTAEALPQLCDTLYGLAPEEFTPARDDAAAQARAAGDRQLAAGVAALRKPTLAAWLANLLVRAQPDELDQLLDIGVALREAQQQLAGPQLRQLLSERHAVVTSLVRSARRAAAEAGHPVTETVAWDVETTLTLALSDDRVAAAVRSGRLVSAARRDTAAVADVREALDAATAAAARAASTTRPAPARRAATSRAQRRAPAAAAGDGAAVPTVGDGAAGSEADDLARRREERARAALADAVHARHEQEHAEAAAAAEDGDARAAVDDAAHAEQVAVRQVHTAAAEVARLQERLRAAQVAVDDAERSLAQARATRVDADETAGRAAQALAAARTALDAARTAEEEARAAVTAAGPPSRRRSAPGTRA
jgi:hypothetical protein